MRTSGGMEAAVSVMRRKYKPSSDAVVVRAKKKIDVAGRPAFGDGEENGQDCECVLTRNTSCVEGWNQDTSTTDGPQGKRRKTKEDCRSNSR